MVRNVTRALLVAAPLLPAQTEPGQPLVVDNRLGAGGNVSMGVAKAGPAW
jgi:hypothetical protein